MRRILVLAAIGVLAGVVNANAQVNFPGSMWTITGTLSPAESGNVISMTHAEQGISLKGAELFTLVTVRTDSQGYDWNRSVTSGAGVRYTIGLPGGMIRVAAAYATEQRFVKPNTTGAMQLTVDGWFGWNLRRVHP